MISRKKSKGTSSLRIVAFGYIIRGPLGGFAWAELHYLMGLVELGHDVYFIEDSDDYPSCYDPMRDVFDTDPTYGLKFTAGILEKIELGNRWAYYDAHTSHWYGPCAERVFKICETADILLNLTGLNQPLRPWLRAIPVRAFIDKDPVFTQIRIQTEPEAKKRALQHTAFFSFAMNSNSSPLVIPEGGLPWQATRHPIFLDAWPVVPGRPRGKFTTVMLWDSYPVREHNGRFYGMKSESFRAYVELPKFAETIFELALGGPTAPRNMLRSKGWIVCNPLEVTRDLPSYQYYIQQSKAEFSVAKHGYVVSRCGWFSERSAAYLASGRPVAIQETGFSDWMETGVGVISFDTPEKALAGIEEINSRYSFHCRAAREIAEEYFDARKVLSRLIECAMNSDMAPVNNMYLTTNGSFSAFKSPENHTAIGDKTKDER